MEARRKNIRVFLRILDQLPEKITSFRKKYQQRIFLFLFFVVIATIFWTIRSLNEEYEDEILYPVKYDNIPKNKVLVNKPPDKLKLKIKAVGRIILIRKYSYILRPLKFNVNSFYLNTIGTDSSYILTKTARSVLSKELGDIKVLDISPDTLFFIFTEMITKKVGVKHNIINYHKIFAKQYMLNGKISYVPDSIIVSGPNSILDTLKNVCTELIDINNLNDTVEKTYMLKKINRVAFSKKKVKLIIPVDKFTELSYLVNINHLNVPDTLILKTFPNSVRITFRVTLTYFDRVRPETFEPYVDFNDIETSISSKLKVMLNDVPEYIHSVTVYPSSVEFLIEM